MSLNHDKKGLEFISTLEHRKYPFYGVQFHPEKNLYEWVTEKNIPHGSHAVQISQYFANFFVNEGKCAIVQLHDQKSFRYSVQNEIFNMEGPSTINIKNI
jgi:hypothetical protein